MPAGPGGATCARCWLRPTWLLAVVSCSASCPGWRGSRGSRPRRRSRWSWWARPRAGRRRAWRFRPSSAGGVPCWPPASRTISSVTPWGRGRARVRCGASTRPAVPVRGAVPGPPSPCAASGVTRVGPRPNCVRRPRAKARRGTVSSGTPPPPSSSPPSSSPLPSTGAPWPTSCAGWTPRRSGRWRPSSSAPHRPRSSKRRRRPGAVTIGRGAPSTRRPRRCSHLSPMRHQDQQGTARSNRANCSAIRTRCTSVRRLTTNAGYADTSPR